MLEVHVAHPPGHRSSGAGASDLPDPFHAHQLADVERAAGRRRLDVTRQQARDETVRRAEVAQDQTVDLRSTEEVLVERNGLDLAAELPAADPVGAQADELARPVRMVHD